MTRRAPGRYGVDDAAPHYPSVPTAQAGHRHLGARQEAPAGQQRHTRVSHQLVVLYLNQISSFASAQLLYLLDVAAQLKLKATVESSL